MIVATSTKAQSARLSVSMSIKESGTFSAENPHWVHDGG